MTAHLFIMYPTPKDPNQFDRAYREQHLPFAGPRFGTPCAATESPEQRRVSSEYAARMIASMNNGLMGCAIADPTMKDDHDQPAKSAKSTSAGY